MANHDLSFCLLYLAALSFTVFAAAGTQGAASVYYACVPLAFCLLFLAALIFGGSDIVAKQVGLRMRRGKIGDAMLFYRSARLSTFLFSFIPAVIFGCLCVQTATALGERYSYLAILSLLPALVFGSQLGPSLGFLLSVGLSGVVRFLLGFLSAATVVITLILTAFASGKAAGIGLLLRKHQLIYVYAGAGLGLGISAALTLTFLISAVLCFLVSRNIKSREEPLAIDRDEHLSEVLPYYCRLLLPSLVPAILAAVLFYIDYRIGFAEYAGDGSHAINMNTFGGFFGGCLPVLVLAACLVFAPFSAMPARFYRLLFNQKKKTMRYEFSMTLRLLAYLGIPVSLFLFGAAKPIIQICHSGFGQAAKDGAILSLKLSCGSAFLLAMAFFWILLLLATGYQAVLLVSFVIGAVVQTAAYVLLLSVLPFPIEASGLALFFFLLAFNLSALILGRRELLAQTDLSFLQDYVLILLAGIVALIPVELLNDFMTYEIIPVGGVILLAIVYTVLYMLFSILFQAADLLNVSQIPGGKYVCLFAKLLGVIRE